MNFTAFVGACHLVQSGLIGVFVSALTILRLATAVLCVDELQELRKREKEQGIEPDWEVDAMMKAATIPGKRYVLSCPG